MSRGKTLGSLITSLRAEARLSLNPAHNNQTRDSDVILLQRTQEWLWEDFAWPHLRVKRDIACQAGQRYYAPPEDIRIDRIEKIWFRDGDRWLPLKADITRENYNFLDSDTDQRDWPARRWRISEDEQIEIWPILNANADPVTLNGMIRVEGIRNLRPLVTDANVADLDDRLIVLYAAAERSSDEKLAAKKLNLANKRMAALRANLMPAKTFKMFGLADRPEAKLRGPPTVYYRTDS